jgi:hypothetical protein
MDQMGRSDAALPVGPYAVPRGKNATPLAGGGALHITACSPLGRAYVGTGRRLENTFCARVEFRGGLF